MALKSRLGRTLEDVRHVAEACIAPFFRAITAQMAGVDPRSVRNLDESMCSAVDTEHWHSCRAHF